jgi:hypothetical protein
VFPILGTGFIGIDYGTEERELGPDEFIWGANMAYRSAAVKHLRFNPQLGRVGTSLVSGDDADYLARARNVDAPVVYSPGMRLRHYVDPTRMTEEYLLAFYEGLGVTAGRLRAAPGPAILGVPLWVIRRLAEAKLAAVIEQMRGRRIPRLQALRDYRRCRGIVRGTVTCLGRGGDH